MRLDPSSRLVTLTSVLKFSMTVILLLTKYKSINLTRCSTFLMWRIPLKLKSSNLKKKQQHRRARKISTVSANRAYIQLIGRSFSVLVYYSVRLTWAQWGYRDPQSCWSGCRTDPIPWVSSILQVHESLESSSVWMIMSRYRHTIKKGSGGKGIRSRLWYYDSFVKMTLE